MRMLLRALMCVMVTMLSVATPRDSVAQCGGRWLASPVEVSPGQLGTVSAFLVMPNGDVIVAGYFRQIGDVTVNHIARWNGSQWSSLGSGVDEGGIFALALMPNGDIIAGGYFQRAGGVVARNIARWNGLEWAPLGLGITGTDTHVGALVVMPNGNLVAGGNFIYAGGQDVRYIAQWDGLSWSGFGSGMTGPVSALALLPNGNLVAGGSFTMAGGVYVHRIAMWSGTHWSGFGYGMNDSVADIRILRSGDLIAAGVFTLASNVNATGVARWNGAEWSAMGDGLSGGLFPIVQSVTELENGDLIASGNFLTSGNVPVNRIARWNGSTWTSLGTGASGSGVRSVSAIAALASGELIAGGEFTEIGNVISPHFARWTETGIPWIARQPLPQTVNAEETLTLTATCASGYDFDGPVTYQWQRNGVNIVNGAAGASPNGGTVTGASGALPTPTTNPTATLTITGAKPGDTGAYTIIFANGCGSVTSTPAMITVTGNCTADFNSDTVVDLFDYLDFVAAFAANAPEADFNADTVIDFFDYLDFVEEFATGC